MSHETAERTPRLIEPVAAEAVFDGNCEYEDCGRGADWLIEVEGGAGFLCCQECSAKNRIYALENDLYKTEVSDAARRSAEVRGNDGE